MYLKNNPQRDPCLIKCEQFAVSVVLRLKRER